MKKAAFFDIDGTLIDVSTGMTAPTARVRAALAKLKDAGHYAFIASGRPLDFLSKEILSLGFDGFILMNGAVVIVGDEIVYDEPIDRAIVNDIVDKCEKYGLEYIFESYPKVFLHEGFTLMERFFRRIEVDVDSFVRDFDNDDVFVYKMEFLIENTTDEVRALYAKWLNSPELTGISDPAHFNNLELYSRKNTKGSGILHALEYLNVSIENSFAFGDGLNDLEMIQTVGCGMAMSNGNDKLKSLAKHIVPGVHDDGVAFGIEHYILEATIQ